MRHILVLFGSNEVKEIQPFTRSAAPAEKKGEMHCRVSQQAYLDTVNKLLGHIRRGDIYEINYCIEFFATGIAIDPQKVYGRLKDLTGAPFAGIYQCGEDIIICASPERFIRREGGRLISQPMKGTAPRGRDARADEALKRQLASSLKEQTENVMALDVARNDLSRIAEKGTVKTTELFGVQSFANVHQLVSTVQCELRPGTGLGEILAATFPPASMTGAPKISACRLIEKYERSPRGIYSGCLGWIDDSGDFDLCVVIRTLVYSPGRQYLSFHVGSAITAAADPAREWEECLLKADALLRALGLERADVKFPE
jgi:para-aminobenzoate synthetase component I